MEIKALSEYLENGASWGEDDSRVTLSAKKLVKAVTDAIVARKPLYKKVLKVADHFHIAEDGTVTRYATSGEYRKAAEKDGLTRVIAGRKGKEGKTVTQEAYRDFVILDVEAFEEWLSKTIIDDKIDVIKKQAGRGEGKPKSNNGIFSLADFKKGRVEDAEAAAKLQSENISKLKTKGAELGNMRKEQDKS